MKLTTVLSGGQTGVDRAALRAARAAGLEIDGWCPPGRIAEDGRIPDHFPLKETPADRSPDAPDVPRSLRSEWNVRDADATLVMTPPDVTDAGTEVTTRFARKYRRPLMICDPAAEDTPAKIEAWVLANRIRRLNIAGPSESAAPGITEAVYKLLTRVFANDAQ